MSEAGSPGQTGQIPAVSRRPSPKIAIIGLIVGIVGLFISGVPCGILTIILGVVSYLREKNALAWLVLILGIVDIATALIIIYFFPPALT